MAQKTTVFTPEKRKQFLELIQSGQTRIGSAQAVGVSWNTIKSYMRAHPKYAGMVKKGRRVVIDHLEDALYTQAMSGNFQAIRFMLINMTRDEALDEGDIKWKSENANIEVSGPNGKPIETYALTREERLERLKALTEEVQSELESSEGLPKLDQIIKKEEEKE